jgi:heterogeneous nuclear rnp K-like protein
MTFETEVQLRFLVTTKDAGIIIGKNGSQISKVREETNVQIGVSNLIPNVKERVVTITGELRNVAMVLFI